MRHAIKLVVLFASWSASAAAQEPPATTAMSLREAVNYALEHSPDLKAAHAETGRREGVATAARSYLLPQVEVSADASRTRLEHGYPAGTTPSLLRYDTALFSGSANVGFLAWDFRRTEFELAAARERVEAARGGEDRRRQEVVFETARLYLQALTYEDLIHAATVRSESLRSLLDRTNDLVRAGRAVPVDALKIQARLAQVESDLAMLQSGRRTSLATLAAVMGFEGDLPDVNYTPAPATAPANLEPEGQLLEEAAKNRPDIRSQDHEVQAGERTREAARKASWPRIDLRASVTEYGSGNPVGFPQLIGRLLPGAAPVVPAAGNAATDWLVGVRVSVPLFDGGRRRGQVEAATAQLEEARFAREQLARRIDREVRTARADLDAAESRVKALRDSVAESERVLHDEQLKYGAGRSVVNFVLDAESALLTNQSLLSQAQRSVATASLAVDLSLGRIGVERLPNQ